MPTSLESKRLLTIGDYELFQVPEITIATSVRWFMPDTPSEVVAQAREALSPILFDEDGRLIQSIHTYVLKSADRVILIDTGVGNQKSRAGRIPAFDMLDTPFLSRLSAIGVSPDEVDVVLCTHMHVDHLGWNTFRDGERWIPTFPNARYLFVEAEYDAFIENAESDPAARLIRKDTVDPITSAGLVDLVSADHEFDATMRFEPSHGHSPGHVNIIVGSGDQTAVFIGDVMHNAIQVLVPGAESPLNGPAEATATRIDVIRKYADTGVIVFGAHFSAPCGGYIESSPTGYTFTPLDEA